MTPDLIAGRYQVLRPVGRGGMGTVWLCRDEVLGREVAVKQIGSLPGESATDTARALREARSSAALNHRNVVSVFDIVDTEDGNAWLVMEYVPSHTLAEIVRNEGPIAPQRAAWIAAQVAEGLAAAHALGTIHRDVKPGNILVGENDVAKISDFGIARGADDDQLTRTGLVTGTPSYFSPELARGEDPGPESDVYALGATLYTAVEGRSPYPEQRNAIVLLQKIAAEEPPKPTNAGPLAGPIARMMDRDAGSRWTMADAAHALRRVAEDVHAGAGNTAVLTMPSRGRDRAHDDTRTTPVPVAAAAPATSEERSRGYTPPPPPPDDQDKGRRSGPWLVGAGVLLLLLLGVGYMMLSGGPDDQAPQASTQSNSPPSKSRSSSPTPTPTPTPTPSPSREPREKQTSQAPATDPGDAMEQDVTDYFALMPENTDAGWQRLAPSMKAQGRGAYEEWWGSIDSVDLSRADAVEGGQPQVKVDLTYYFNDGSAKQETQLLTLEKSGDRYLIADDEVLSSRTVS
jgi:serine/threonine protein kinase